MTARNRRLTKVRVVNGLMPPMAFGRLFTSGGIDPRGRTTDHVVGLGAEAFKKLKHIQCVEVTNSTFLEETTDTVKKNVGGEGFEALALQSIIDHG